MQLVVSHQPEQSRFITEVDGKKAVLLYHQIDASVLDLRSTFVPDELRMRGIGEGLVTFALRYAQDRALRVRPSCWFVGLVIDKYPEFKDLVVQ